MAKKDVEFPVRKVILMTEEMADRISKRRFDSRVVSENEMIRRLLKAALDGYDKADAAKAAAKPKPKQE